jgi:hypothetical protein
MDEVSKLEHAKASAKKFIDLSSYVKYDVKITDVI